MKTRKKVNIRLIGRILLCTFCVFTLTNCKKDTQIEIFTLSVNSIEAFSAISGGIITNEGCVKITSKGVCWSTENQPTIFSNSTDEGSGIGTFTSEIKGLKAFTTYYIRAYATTKYGTRYGNELTFKTKLGDTIMDIDNNIYLIVQIGTQTWMAEDLRVTHYLNGDDIETTSTSFADITSIDSPKYQWSQILGDANSRLYTFYAVIDNRKIAPAGWHIPSYSEWNTLIEYLGGQQIAGSKLKETGNSHWIGYNSDADNSSGFTALPFGERHKNGNYLNPGFSGTWWSSSTVDNNSASFMSLWRDYAGVLINNGDKKFGKAVRCIKD